MKIPSTFTKRRWVLLPLAVAIVVAVLFTLIFPADACYKQRASGNIVPLLGSEFWFQGQQTLCVDPIFSPISFSTDRQLVEMMLMALLATVGMAIVVTYKRQTMQVSGLTRQHEQQLQQALQQTKTQHEEQLKYFQIQSDQQFQQLQEQNGHKMQQLQSTHQQELDESRRGFQMLLDGLEHELRNHITAVEATRSNLVQIGDPKIESAVRGISAHRLERMRTISKDLRIVLEANTLDPQALQKVSIETLLKTVVEDEEEYAHEQGKRIDFPPPMLLVREVAGNQNLLSTAFSNLLRNAIRYGRSRVEVKVIQAPGGVAIHIQDDGIGIPKAEQERIFAPHYRGSNADPTSGTGIGLWLTQTIIRKHNGNLSLVESIEGQGSVFAVWLPRYNEPK